ncbi:hybrid-cluster NAD(P)-dependent oxidoreductase [Aliamphritea ceti]|uniref:hybrid-cluster NAD(P)-dependent oxidoreductase n=1 Tax=Aliamphritea ceti TaxID=1524258 RepID=UPI0021C3130E|nr:hybrid-cluster NAD(P)-dependent oxidoreductase [Aliamphritea ceti]
MNMTLLVDNLPTWQTDEKAARCIRVVNETWDVKTFWFSLADDQPLHFKPGQFLSFTFNIKGENVSRCYSIASSPAQPYQFGVTVKRVPGGLVSNWLHDNLFSGSETRVLPATGHFNCIDYKADKYLLLSGGSGITPGMSMVRWIQDTGEQADVHFVHSARSPEDIIFYNELLEIDAQRSNFQLSVLCEEKSPGRGWSGYRGRLNAALLENICPDYKDRTVMCCGPAPYMNAVRQMLESLQFPMQNYVEESFGSPPAASPEIAEPAEHDNVKLATEISFSNSNKTADSTSAISVLEAAQASGVWIQAACRSGICGSCKVLKTSGDVSMDNPMALSDSDRDAGYILACCAYPESDLTIEA